MEDMVNHPKHYSLIPDKDIEVIDVIESVTKDMQGFQAVCVGNAIKYLLRCNKKNTFEENLKKCRWYINKILGDE